MDISPSNTPEPFQSNAPHSADHSDDQELILRLRLAIRDKIVDNFGEHIRVLEANGEPVVGLKRKLVNDNKWIVQDLIDLPMADKQSRQSTVEFQLEFSLRNRLLANVAKNNLFIRDPNNARFTAQFKADLVDENHLLIAFLNSLDEERIDGAQGSRAHQSTRGDHQASGGSEPASYQFGQSPWSRSPSSQNDFATNASAHQNGNSSNYPPNYPPNTSNLNNSNAASFSNNPPFSSDHSNSTRNQNSNGTSKFTADGLLAEIVRLEITGFTRFMNGTQTQSKSFRIANSKWMLKCVPATDCLELVLGCCEDGEYFFHIDEMKLWLVSPKLDHSLQGFDKLYGLSKDFVLTKSQSIRMTIRLSDLFELGYLKNDTLSLKVVLKLHP